jgi:hypothetical protein
MPHLVATVEKANLTFGGLQRDVQQRDDLRRVLQSSNSVLEVVEQVDMLSGLDAQGVEDAQVFFGALPGGLQAALLSALDNALERNLQITFAWKPGYDFELQIWEAAEGDVGALNVMIASPWPRHLRERA